MSGRLHYAVLLMRPVTLLQGERGMLLKRAGAVVLAAVALATAAGCERGDPRLANLSPGISKDSVLTVMGGPPHRLDPYLSKGQYIEAMYYPRRAGSSGDDLQDRNMTPVVVINGNLAGWGWSWWDSTAADHRIEVAAKGR